MQRKRTPPEDRFWTKVAENPETGCWDWLGYIGNHGYGVFWVGRRCLAHRFAYEYVVGVIPPHLQIDHLCRNRACVNPAHLEAVTPRENYRRGESPFARHARQTHCLSGHPLSGDNLYIHPQRGTRNCRACKSAAMTRYYERQRERSG